jgi:hypothetical protein
LEGIGAALLFSSCQTIISPYNTALYHHGLPVTNLIGGLLLDMLGVAILVTGVLVAVQHLPAAIQGILNSLFAGLMLWRIVDLAIQMLASPEPIIQHYVFFYKAHVREQSCIVMLLLSGILAYSVPRITQTTVRAIRLVIASLAFSALWIIPQLLHIAMLRQPDESAASIHLPTLAHIGSSQRIIWILFDELSYDQTLDHPAPGVKLPNLDRLRTVSVSFSRLKPAGFFTEAIIPSLFLGRRIDRVRSSVHGDLWYKEESKDQWRAFEQNATLFALAQRSGWSSGVSGTYNPYCHILASVLSACSWEPSLSLPMEQFGAAEQKSALANAAVLPNALLAKLTNSSAEPEDAHIVEYRNVMVRTQALIENEQVSFVFLHLPVPHPPGIYDRERHMLRSGGTYLDNLVLADETLGALLNEIGATSSASRTTVIVSSDHSWRIPIWRPAPGWSAEEERASGGRFDDRPVLLIHFPGQNLGSDVNSVLPELLEHDIIAEMLCGKINNSKELAAFLNLQGR